MPHKIRGSGALFLLWLLFTILCVMLLWPQGIIAMLVTLNTKDYANIISYRLDKGCRIIFWGHVGIANNSCK